MFRGHVLFALFSLALLYGSITIVVAATGLRARAAPITMGAFDPDVRWRSSIVDGGLLIVKPHVPPDSNLRRPVDASSSYKSTYI